MRHTRSRSYTAYGAVCGVVSGSRLAFCGEYRDALAGHYLLGNGRRAYNPALMRFNSADTLSPFGRGGINTYAYCLNDPINRVDRNGAFSFPKSVYFAVLAMSWCPICGNHQARYPAWSWTLCGFRQELARCRRLSVTLCRRSVETRWARLIVHEGHNQAANFLPAWFTIVYCACTSFKYGAGSAPRFSSTRWLYQSMKFTTPNS
ncbi:RHS repeat-associated core domain-containing protein [Pseudomonas sp. LAIL14HWK12:I11]|nr:RHS repeat-associated core domain-containing protein [Pseudomonas sp. LAIL14HWK12:I11]SMR78642.1 RHS repeat-associated core domain-containing protein [Pseudomonas sp. LAIL14HWK12:I10]SOD06823.1 RHS repeat-associated core domain-containing protein [Pseudomonas sp. LAIL14HWK12:I8]